MRNTIIPFTMTEYTLRDLLTIKNGRDHKDLADGKYPVYGSGGIMRYVDAYLYDKPSILLPRKGSLSNIQFCETPFWTVDTTYYTEINETLCDPYYLYRYLTLLNLASFDSGSTVPSMTFDSYYHQKVLLPSLSEQKRASKVLRNIDNKIQLNEQINRNLEELARLIYDYWFVQFDFPDKNGKPYKTSGGKMVYNDQIKREIPAGWEVVDINKLCQVVDCLHSKKPNYCFENERFYLLSLENITKDGYIDLSDKYYISQKDFEEWTSRICVKENDFLFTNAGRAGDMGMVPKGVECAIGRNITSVRPIAINPWYLRCFFKSLYMREQILGNLDQGSFFMSFNVRSIKKLKILIPPPEILDIFLKKTESYLSEIENNLSEIAKLVALRNRLLPLLMNGQVSVKNMA